MLDQINFKEGYITFDHLLYLKNDNQIKKESAFWGEDLLQVNYFNNCLLDVGWHQKQFTILCVKNQKWEKPIFTARASSLKHLKKLIEVSIKIIYKKNQ